MLLPFAAIVGGLILLVWSADRFIDGSAAAARHFGMPPLLIGMLVIGFGTSAPEMMVSAIAAADNNPGLALGNAYGSNIANIALILGLTALISPITVHSRVLRRELPILTVVSLLTIWQLWDGEVTRMEAVLLLLLFGGLVVWSIWEGRQDKKDELGTDTAHALADHRLAFPWAIFWMLAGLAVLVASSRLLVWGAVEVARGFGVSDLMIGLTVVAVGTSLPELAASLIATRKGEHDLALGNVVGSNLFNTLAVVGIAGFIHPISVGADVISRDIPVMILLTISLFAIGYGFRGRQGRINRVEAAALLLCYAGYTAYLIKTGFLSGS